MGFLKKYLGILCLNDLFKSYLHYTIKDEKGYAKDFQSGVIKNQVFRPVF